MVKDPSVDYEIVVFSDEWFGLPFSCKHLLRHFLPHVPIIWGETIGLRSPRLNAYDIKRSIIKIAGWLSSRNASPESLPMNLDLLDPFQIPYNHLSIVREFNKRMITRSLKKLRGDRLGERKRVLITTWPFVGNMIGCLDESLSIYMRVDDFSEFPGVRKNTIRRLETKLIRKVDFVVATAERLTHVETGRREVRYLPHGVDFEHFSQGGKGTEEGLPIKRIHSPRIGFFGLLSSWIDFDLVARLAAMHPRWSFVFIGPSQLTTTSLPQGKNLHYLGPVSYEDLPKHAKYFDLGLIPFKVNSLTLGVNPLKMMEYMALGIPVVSSPLPEVMKYKDFIYIGDGFEAFGEAICQAIKEDNGLSRERRKLVAKEHSWMAKALQLRQWIEDELELKKGA